MVCQVINFLAAVLLLQSSFSTAFPSSIDHSSSVLARNDETFTMVREPTAAYNDAIPVLNKFIFDSYVELAYSRAKAAKDVFVKVLQDDTITTRTTPDMFRYSKQLTAFVGIMEALQSAETPNEQGHTTSKHFNQDFMVFIFARMQIFLDTLYSVPAEKLNEEDNILKMALERHGIDTWQKNVYEDFEKLFQKILHLTESNKILENVKDTGKQTHGEFVDFIKKLKTTDDVVKRLKMFYDYLNIDTVDSE